LLHPLLQCFDTHLCSTRICQTGIRVRWQILVKVSFEDTTTRVSSNHNSHTFCFVLFLEWHFVVVCGGLFFCFFVAQPLAVFAEASVFNSDVSKWNTGAARNMKFSKCYLWPRLPLLCFWIRQLEFIISILTRSVLFLFLERYFFVVCGVGCSFFVSRVFCSVYSSTCVQFRCVQMEYGGGGKYVWQ